MGMTIDIDAFRKRYLFHANLKAEEEFNQIIHEIKKYDTPKAIPKDQYEQRLKADMVAMLTDIQLEIEDLKSYESADGQDLVMLTDIGILFQQKINALKGEKE